MCAVIAQACSRASEAKGRASCARMAPTGTSTTGSDSWLSTVARPWPIGRAHHAAGGVSSTVLDLVRYARFHLSDGEEVLTRASLDEMQRPQAAAAPIFGSVGLAWGIDDSSGVRIVHHGGGTNGQIAHLSFAPESGTILVVLTNGQRGGEVVQAALARVVEALGGHKPERVSVVIDPAEYLGTYRSSLLDAEVGTTRSGGATVKMRLTGTHKADDTLEGEIELPHGPMAWTAERLKQP